ncbi:MAG: pseudouridine synthase [Kofleriaceae bacterium]
MSEPLRVTVQVAGRVDKELARQFPGASRRRLAEMFEHGYVRVAGKRASKGDRVEPGEVIELTHAPITGDAVRPAPDPAAAAQLIVLIERVDVIAVCKPAGMPSQPLRPNEHGTAASGIVHTWPECADVGDDSRDGGLVHRLDIGTSGVLVAARTPERYRALRSAFGAGLVDKTYLAICDQRPVSRECDAPLAQRGRHVVVDHTDGLPAFTSFVVERATAAHSLVRCTSQTGRMHQVRAHLAHVGSPIAGDTLYGGAVVPGTQGFFLHASSITIPLDGERLTIEAPIPQRFTDALARCGLG